MTAAGETPSAAAAASSERDGEPPMSSEEEEGASRLSAPSPPPAAPPSPAPAPSSPAPSASVPPAATTTTAKTTATTTTTTAGPAVESSPQDERSYLSVTLPNRLRCLLISDPNTDKAAAAMDVRVGHLSDPECAPGLAHFCEHMLFLGTEKFPDEHEYNVFLVTHGGRSNAFTDMEDTNFYFDVGAVHLEGALDRFAQFFIGPLFTPEATDREMNAVESEHSKNVQSDHWRTYQLYKSLASDHHPFRKFGSGNLETLRDRPKENGVDIRRELLAFHERYYSANVMRLAVLGKESLDELRDLVERLFSDVRDRGVDPPTFPGSPYRPDQLGRRIDVVPVGEKREVEISFPLREVHSLYLRKPLKYISHLIGHEGRGSILALLRERGWGNELSAGESRQCSDWSCFSVTVELTDEGLERVNDVAEVVFAYVNLLRREGPQRWIHDETATVADCNFRFLSKREPADYVCSLAGAMQLYAEEHALSGPYRIWEYDPDVIAECMEFLTPRNALVAVFAKSFEGKTREKERWYGVDYSVCDIDEATLKRWEDADVDSDLAGGKLTFPKRNDMIATDFDLRRVPDFPRDEPRLLVDTPGCRLWYKPDNVFDMPKINVMAMLWTSAAYESPEAAVLASLYVEILREHTTEFSYLATMAGLDCAFVNARGGIELHVSGYSHRAGVLLGRIVDAMLALPERLDEDEYERIQDKVSKQYQNFLVAQPFQHAFYGADLCLEMSKWSIHDKIRALESASAKDVAEFSKRLLSRFRLEMLVHGNASPDEARRIADAVMDRIKPDEPFEANLPQLRAVKLEEGREYVYRFGEYNAEDANSCLATVYQVGRIDLRTNSVLSFLNHIVQEPAFNELRTKEQLGYVVHNSVKTTGDDIKGLLILIMSEKYDPIHLDERVEAFIKRFRSKIVKMSKDKFQSNIKAVETNFLEKNKNLGEESSKYWSAVTDHKYMFRKFQLLGAEVVKLTKEDVLQFFDKYVARDSPRRSKLCVQVFGKKHIKEMGSEVEKSVTVIGEDDVVEFKRSMPLYPLPEKVDVEGMKMTDAAN